MHAGARLFLGIASLNFLGDMFGGGHIFQRGDFEIRLAAGHDGNRLVRQIVDHYPSVIGGVEIRVGCGQFVCTANRGESERLRCLRTERVRAVRHRFDHFHIAEMPLLRR